MKKENAGKKKRRLLKALGMFFLVVAACVIFVFWYAYYSNNSQAYKDSEKAINKVIALQVGKDPNELTKEDYEKIENINIYILKMSTLKPIVKLKNLKKINFLIVDEYVDVKPDYTFLDFRPLAKLNNLRDITFRRVYISRTISPARKKQWYDGILSIIHKFNPPSSQDKLIDLAKLKSLKNLESLTTEYYITCNYEALANLKNLKRLNLRDAGISRKELNKLREALPDLKIE